VAKAGFPFLREYFPHLQARDFLDEAIQIDEAPAEPPRQVAADGALADSHKTNECDVALSRRY
jgi:hypothetical protein